MVGKSNWREDQPIVVHTFSDGVEVTVSIIREKRQISDNK